MKEVRGPPKRSLDAPNAESNGVGYLKAPSRKAREGAHPQIDSIDVQPAVYSPC
jgi:hypothetical protein